MRRYGLADIREDAQQACAIAVHRALAEYDGGRSAFATFATWKIRAELQALRHKMRLDQRPAAVRTGARTVSLDAVPAGEAAPIPDEGAEARVEHGANRVMARRMVDALLDDYAAARLPAKPGTVAPDRLRAMEARISEERALVSRHLLGTAGSAAMAAASPAAARSREQRRQVVRRVLRHLTARVEREARWQPVRTLEVAGPLRQ